MACQHNHNSRSIQLQMQFPLLDRTVNGKGKDLKRSEPATTSTKEDIPLGMITVGIVDDDPHVLMAMESLAISFGYNVISSLSGIEIWQQIASGSVSLDILVTDLDMPQMHGHELSRRVRLFNPKLPIIVVSGAITERDQIADRHIPKPFAAEDFKRTIDELYRNGRQQRIVNDETASVTSPAEPFGVRHRNN